MARPLLALTSLILLAGAIVLQFFVILSGGVKSLPENKIYFLQASTDGISGNNVRNPSRWTFWAICGVDIFNDRNEDCGSPVPALPFYPQHRTNFDTIGGVPSQFVDTRHYYYLSRFAWVFYLIALLFAVTAFFTGALALCTRIGAYLSSFTTFVALFCQTLAAALMTAWTVQARNVWRRNGFDAKLGQYAYGFSWGAVALLFLSTVTFCLAGGRSRDHAVKTTAPPRRRGFFGRRHRSVRTRKEEYA